MGKIFFTSDHHFGNSNIIKYENRPFSSTEEMDEILVNNWNSVVSPKDTVFHLGDFCLGRNARDYFKLLNGIINVLDTFWHHDKYWLKQYKKGILFESKNKIPIVLLRPIDVNYIKDIWTVISHNPFAEWDRKHYGSLHLHGHSHGHLEKIPNRIDVGVDCWNYFPVNFDQIIEEIKK